MYRYLGGGRDQLHPTVWPLPLPGGHRYGDLLKHQQVRVHFAKNSTTKTTFINILFSSRVQYDFSDEEFSSISDFAKVYVEDI
jgi:hypothetical protein